MATTLGELVIELGVLGDDEGAKKVAKAIDEAIDKAKEYAKQQKQQEKQEQNNAKSSGNLAKNIKNVAVGLGGVITAVSGAVIALNKLAESLVQQNQQWINLTRNSDIALSTFQKWGQVGAAMNASLGEMGAAGAIADLNERLFEMKLTGQGYEGFALAGIMPTNAEDVMEQLRSRIQGLSDTSATYLLKRLGIDPRMLSVLRMTREEFNSLTKELEKYQLTMEQRQQIQEFHKQMSIVNVKMQYFKDRILIALLPHIERIMKLVVNLTEMFIKHKGVVLALGLILTKTFSKWLKALPLIGKFLKPIIKSLQTMRILGKGLSKGLTGIITKLPIVGVLFGKLGKIVGRAFLPLTALYLLIDDVRAFMEGGGSMIGVLLYGFEKINDTINFKSPEWLKDLVTAASKMPDLVAGVAGIKDLSENKNEVSDSELTLSTIRWLNPFSAFALASRAGQSYINNHTSNTSNQVNQNITITTNQPAQATKNEYLHTINNL